MDVLKQFNFYGWFLKQHSGENIFSSTKKYSPEILWDDLTSVNLHSFIGTDKGGYLKQRRVPLRHAQSRRLCDGESAWLVAGPSLQLNGTQPSLTFLLFTKSDKW